MVKKPRRGFFPQGLGGLVRLKDKVVFITGASGGMGRAFCKAFLREGAKVCVTDISEELVKDAVAELGSPESVTGAVVDVCTRPSIEAALGRILQRFGRVDILINTAGGALHTPHKLEEVDERARCGASLSVFLHGKRRIYLDLVG